MLVEPVADGPAGGVRASDATPLLTGGAVGVAGGGGAEVLGTVQVAAIIFFQVAGGPYGIEEIVAYGTPLGALIGIVFIPWIWSVWVALLTAELAALFPVRGSRAMWVLEPFGRGPAFFTIALGAGSNLLDAALYPVMALAYLNEFDDAWELTGYVHWAAGSFVILVVLAINLRGIDIVGWANAVFLAIVCAPFVLMVVLGAYKIDPALWARSSDASDIDWANLIVLLAWNTSGLENFANSAVSIRDRGRTIPRALAITIILATAIYALPIAVGLSYNQEYDKWKEGYFVKIARAIGGAWLGYSVVVTGVIASFGLCNAMLLCASETFLSIGHAGLVGPSFFTIPHINKIGLVTTAAAMSLLITLDFTVIMTLSMVLYSLQLLIFIAAFLRLRYTHASHAVDFRVPLSLPVVAALMVPPAGLCIALVALTDAFTLVFTGIYVLSALVLWFALFRYVAIDPPYASTESVSVHAPLQIVEPTFEPERRSTSASSSSA